MGRNKPSGDAIHFNARLIIIEKQDYLGHYVVWIVRFWSSQTCYDSQFLQKTATHSDVVKTACNAA